MFRNNSSTVRSPSSQQWFLEIALVLICLALCWLLYMIGDYRMVVLHLFYLPVVLAAFFLGRYRAGVLALLCAIGAAMVLTAEVTTVVSFNSPVVVWLALAVWSAVLGLVAIMAGTLSDERAAKIAELHDAYVGVVEVLSRYLSSADANTNDLAVHVSQLSQQVAARLGLSSEEIDNIRVAALLQDINHMEITAKVLRRAVGDLQHAGAGKHTFHGRDLLCSLGDVLTGTWPLLLDQGDGLASAELAEGKSASHPAALAAGLLRTVNRYVTLAHGRHPALAPREAIDELRNDFECDHDPAIVRALEWVVVRSRDAAPAEPELCGA
jgi:K+-sensing histidine kinase KdpD